MGNEKKHVEEIIRDLEIPRLKARDREEVDTRFYWKAEEYVVLAKKHKDNDDILKSMEFDVVACSIYTGLYANNSALRDELRKFFNGNYKSVDESRTIH